MVFRIIEKVIGKGVRLIKSKNRITMIMVLLLTALDQIVKIIVKDYYGFRTPIIKDILYFMPTLNDDYSWLNSMFQFGWGKSFHIIIVLSMLIFSYLTFKYLEIKNVKGSMIKILEAFLFSGIICSLVDKVFWNGSLDYILLKGFFVFDLKDCYLTISNFIIIILAIRNWTNLSRIRSRDLIKDYIQCIKKDFP